MTSSAIPTAPRSAKSTGTTPWRRGTSRGRSLSVNWLRVSHIGLCYCRVWRNLIQEVESTRGTRGQSTMSTRAKHAATTPIPVQLSAPEFNEFILPHLSRPKRGPKGKLGDHRVFNLILWVLYTGMPWQCLPIPRDGNGKPAIHDTNVYRAFATWADDGSLEQAFIASVAHLAAEQHLDLRVLQGDGTNTVAK